MKAIVYFLLFISISSVIRADEDSIISDFLRGPAPLEENNKEPMTLKKRALFFSKGLGYLSVWAVSASSIYQLLARTYGHYKELERIEQNYREALQLSKEYNVEITKEQKQAVADEMRPHVVKCLVFPIVAGCFIYYYLKFDIPKKSYHFFKQSVGSNV